MRTRLLHPEQLLEALAPPAPAAAGGLLAHEASGARIGARDIPASSGVVGPEAARRGGERRVGIFGSEVGGVGAVRLEDGHGGRAD